MKKIIKFFCLLIIILSFTFLNMINIKAASATISVSSSTSRVVIGNTFNVTIKISSSSSLGAWEWTIDYDKKKLQLISGEANVADVFEKENTKSKSYTYKFKAIGTGSSKISVKSYGALDTSENSLSLSISSKTISVITQAELEATYSKNNNLKSLSIDGLKLEPSFSKNTTDYKVEANANTEEIKINASLDDSKSSLTGTGTHKVSEGDNKFKIVVTAENGSTKTYTITISVKDPNPINIKINDEELTVVKRESSLEAPEEFEKTTIEINEQKVPGFYNETNDITLVGLKDANGEIGLYIYNKNSNNYSKYTEVSMNDIKLLPLEIEDSFSANTNLIDNNKNDYFKTKININSVEFDALKLNQDSDFFIIHARNLLTGNDNYYTYDRLTNTVIRYTDEQLLLAQNKISKYKKLILVLGVETIIIIFVLICMLIKQVSNNKKRKQLYEELEKQKEEENDEKNKKTKRKNKEKKMVDNDEKKENE